MFFIRTILFAGSLFFFVNGESACPPQDGPYPKYFPHETDCSKFYECSNGKSYLLDCPEALHFNSELNVCDWPWRSNCTSRFCTAVDGPLPIYIPHQDCTKFYECSNGVPYLFSCPPNLYFNPKLNVCDYTFAAGCTDSIKENSVVSILN